MIYNGVDLSDFFIVHCPSESILPSIKLSTQSVAGMHGAMYLGKTYEPMSIDVQMLMRPDADRAEALQALAELLAVDEPKELYIGDRCYMAVPSGETALESQWKPGGGTVTFYCPDPIAYGDHRSKRFTTSGTVSIGGDYPTKPIIQAVPASGSLWRITDSRTGKFIRVNYAFNGTNTLLIDCEAQACTIDGSLADRYVTLESDYFELSPGDAMLSATNGSVEVRWRDRWL